MPSRAIRRTPQGHEARHSGVPRAIVIGNIHVDEKTNREKTTFLSERESKRVERRRENSEMDEQAEEQRRAEEMRDEQIRGEVDAVLPKQGDAAQEPIKALLASQPSPT